MDKGFVYAAQLNSKLSAVDCLRLEGVIETIHRLLETAQLDILIAGGEEVPDLYRALTDPALRATQQVFLWYPVLSDYPGMQPDHQVVNFRGEYGAGWGVPDAQDEIDESFAFACPNNPFARAVTMAGLENLLTKYPFNGIFLDKIRFPSPANGLDQVFSCFCPYCEAAAAQEGLDLKQVAALLTRVTKEYNFISMDSMRIPQADWLEAMISRLQPVDQAILAQFLRFRANSISRLVEEIYMLTQRMGIPLALDLFSPGLAYLVGQDYRALANLAIWVKPMSYRYANGPAGLRLEIPQLARGLAKLLDLAPGAVEEWMQSHISGMAGSSIDAIEQDGAPMALIAQETHAAVERMGATPVYMGIEAVSIPAFKIHISPDRIRQMLTIARETGAQGAVLSWDLLHMPEENLRAVHQ